MYDDNTRILVVDDEPNTLKACAATLGMNGFGTVITEADSRRVLELMAGERPDAVILDLFMPNVSGMELLPLIKERYPGLPVVVVTAAYELERAVECMKMGAFDYLVKPVENERLVTTLQKALEWRSLNDQVHALRSHLVEDRLDRPDAFSAIVTRSRKMRALFQYAEVVARSPQPIMIAGESGTGKELMARALYALSGCPGELVSINLAGQNDMMFSDTLFGHRKGAYTGATLGREGLVARAAGGVLFLDEIGDLEPSSQIRLLRLVQEREYYPVGSDVPRRCTARIVCASNRDLKGLVAEGRFRSDLYFRLCDHLVQLPPLRERREDIPLLVEHFITRSAEDLKIHRPSCPRELRELLSVHSFPGNVRELQAMVADAVARSEAGVLSLDPFRRLIAGARELQAGRIAAYDLATLQRKIEDIWGHIPTLNEAEELLVDVALKVADGKQTAAATMLGLKRQSLALRLKGRGRGD